MSKASDIKEPSYKVIAQDKNIEIRQYDPMIVASVLVEGARDEAINKGFQKLADFIFGNNTLPNQKASDKIAMTAPVIQEPSEAIEMTAPVIQESVNNQWVIRFVMPEHYTMETLPKPNNDDVKISQTDTMTRAVVRFSGFATNNNLQKHENMLRAWLDNNDQYIIDGVPYFAFYDPPWTLPFLRRNEVMIPVKMLP